MSTQDITKRVTNLYLCIVRIYTVTSWVIVKKIKNKVVGRVTLNNKT